MSESNQEAYHIPHALFNSISMFNPYQYKPFSCVFEPSTTAGENVFEWNQKNLLITDEVGVGKTFEAGILLQEVLKKNPNARILLVCPVKLAQQWQREMLTHFFLGFTIFNPKLHLESQGRLHLNQLSIVPYSRLKDIKKAHFNVLVLDEAHYIRNEGAAHDSIKTLVERNASSFKIFMTATPIFNSEEDYNNITGLLRKKPSPDGPDSGLFATTTTLQGEANIYDYQMKLLRHPVSLDQGGEVALMNTVMDGGFGFLTGFLKRIATSSLHSLGVFLENRKKKIQEAPERKGESKLLEENQSEESYFDWVSEGEEPTFSQKEEDLLVSCKTWIESGQDSKFHQLTSLLESIQAAPNEQNGCTKGVVLFSCFLSTGKYLQDKLNQYFKNVKNDVHAYQISGGMSKLDVERVIEKFTNQCKSNPQTLTLLICSDAFKEGQNFQFCQHLIHYDFPYTPAALGQRNGRIYRTGQTGDPKSYYMMVYDSYDYRLFGEIIVSKASIVKQYGMEDKISILNVLPSEDANFLSDCMEAYYRDQFDGKSTEEVIFYRLLWKHLFSQDGESSLTKAGKRLTHEEMKQQLSPSIQEALQKGEYLSAFLGIFTQDTQYNQAEKLLLTHQENYKTQLLNFISFFFHKNEGNEHTLEDLKEIFKQHCNDYLEKQNIGAQNFCHHLYVDKSIPFQEYATQFQALCTLKNKED